MQMIDHQQEIKFTQVDINLGISGGIYTSKQIEEMKRYYEYKQAKEAMESQSYYEKTYGNRTTDHGSLRSIRSLQSVSRSRLQRNPKAWQRYRSRAQGFLGSGGQLQGHRT